MFGSDTAKHIYRTKTRSGILELVQQLEPEQTGFGLKECFFFENTSCM